MQEELEHKSVVIATNTAKLTGRGLAALMRAARKRIQEANNAPVIGKQSLKELAKGGTLENIEITNENIKAFEPFARKFGVSYSLKRDNTETPPKWLVFFRSKDTASMTCAFKEFSAKMLTKDKSKESVHALMVKFRELIKNAVRPKVKNKEHEL